MYISCPWHIIWISKEFCYNKWVRNGDNYWDKPDDDIVDWLLTRDESCILDIADGKKATLEMIGNIMGICRERVRQIEGKGKLYQRKGIQGIGKLRYPKGERIEKVRILGEMVA